MQIEMILRRIVTLLPRFSYRFADERALHDGIAHVLADGGISFSREFVAGPRDRFDFLCEPGIVIEAKVQGAIGPAITQCGRYAGREDVNAVVLATSRFWGRGHDAGGKVFQLSSKPVHVVQLRGQSF